MTSPPLAIRQEKRSRSSKKEIILRLLREAGPRGRTNLDLKDICIRPTARIFDLREEGFDIETKPESRGVYRFILHGPRQQELFTDVA